MIVSKLLCVTVCRPLHPTATLRVIWGILFSINITHYSLVHPLLVQNVVQVVLNLEVPSGEGGGSLSKGTICGYGASGLYTEGAFQQPSEMETLGRPHAVEQKQTNGLSGLSSVAR